MVTKLRLYEISSCDIDGREFRHLGYVAGRGNQEAIKRYKQEQPNYADNILMAEPVKARGFRITLSPLEKKVPSK